MKRIKIISSVLALALVLASCTKEQIIQDAAMTYPSELTIDNWEQFVTAPDDVLERIQLAEMQKVTHTPVKGADFDQSRVVLGSLLLGEIQVRGMGINTPTAYLGGTLVRMTLGNTSSNSTSSPTPFYQGQNWFLTNIANSQICFYHQGNTTGTFSGTEWLNGVSTLDLVHIQRHILNITPFTQLWQYVAADANGDGLITDTDINIIRELILGIRINLPPMVPGGYNQPVAYLPQGDYDAFQSNLAGNLPSLPVFYNWLTCHSSANFDTDRYAVKRGDLSGNWAY